MIAGHIAGLVVPNFPRPVTHHVPYGGPSAVLVPSSLNLICRCCGAPCKVLWKWCIHWFYFLFVSSNDKSFGSITFAMASLPAGSGWTPSFARLSGGTTPYKLIKSQCTSAASFSKPALSSRVLASRSSAIGFVGPRASLRILGGPTSRMESFWPCKP